MCLCVHVCRRKITDGDGGERETKDRHVSNGRRIKSCRFDLVFSLCFLFIESKGVRVFGVTCSFPTLETICMRKESPGDPGSEMSPPPACASSHFDKRINPLG